jgi:flagellar motor switch protein FliN
MSELKPEPETPTSTPPIEAADETPAQDEASTAGDGEPVDAAPGKPPNYTRNVLRITVPVKVILASQRTPIHEIIELGPGSIVKFLKTCEEPLELNVGDRPIAKGEVVKVGDKFGLRIGELLKLGEEVAPTQG